MNSRSARVLFLLVVPGHLVFLYTISSMQGGHTTLTLIFIVFYMTAALLQVRVVISCLAYLVRGDKDKTRYKERCLLPHAWATLLTQEPDFPPLLCQREWGQMFLTYFYACRGRGLLMVLLTLGDIWITRRAMLFFRK